MPARQARHCAQLSWGIGTRDEFSIGAYYLTTEGRPIYNHPWRLSSDGKINTTLPARNFYGLESDYNNTESKYITLGHIHRFDDNGELNTRLRWGNYKRDMLASTIGFQNSGITLGQINESTVLTRGSKGRVGESDVLQAQSDYSNTFNWGGKSTPCWQVWTFTTTTPSATKATPTPHPGPRPSWGTPDNGASVVDGRAPCSGTPSRRATWACMRKTPSRSPTPSSWWAACAMTTSCVYRNPAGTISNKMLGQPGEPASA